jgi:hypothetical protein
MSAPDKTRRSMDRFGMVGLPHVQPFRLALSQFNVRPCGTRYSTTDLRVGEYGQILETLKGQTTSRYKLQILSRGRTVWVAIDD